MAKFVTTSEFAELNVGFALDEGIATPHEVFDVYYCERTSWCKLHQLSDYNQIIIYFKIRITFIFL